jgi:hypothetical protein
MQAAVTDPTYPNPKTLIRILIPLSGSLME